MSYNLLILSDSHLFGSMDQELFGVNSYQSLQKLSDYISKSEQPFDLTIALGDLSEDGHPAAYKEFRDLTRELSTSAIWIPGNHDRFKNIPKTMAEEFIRYEWHKGSWAFIFIDTSLKGRDEGEMGEEEHERLTYFLRANTHKYLLIFMHHQPVDIGSEFIDSLGLKNKKAFWNTVSQHPQVRAIVFGHVHQVIDKEINGIRLLSAPSTIIQFKPGSKNLDFDAQSPGYRTLKLNQDGSYETEIHWFS